MNANNLIKGLTLMEKAELLKAMAHELYVNRPDSFCTAVDHHKSLTKVAEALETKHIASLPAATGFGFSNSTDRLYMIKAYREIYPDLSLTDAKLKIEATFFRPHPSAQFNREKRQ